MRWLIVIPFNACIACSRWIFLHRHHFSLICQNVRYVWKFAHALLAQVKREDAIRDTHLQFYIVENGEIDVSIQPRLLRSSLRMNFFAARSYLGVFSVYIVVR